MTARGIVMPTATCPKCKKSFTKETASKAAQALNMHHTRMHTRKGKASATKGGKASQKANRKGINLFPATGDPVVEALCDVIVRLLVTLKGRS